MAYCYYNPNPSLKLTEDCVIRAIAKVTGEEWEAVYTKLAAYGFNMHDMPSSNRVWGRFLLDNGYKRYIVPDTCESGECYTVEAFSRDNPEGAFIVATGNNTHVVAVVDGSHFDTWDSGNEVPTYYWKKEGE